MTGENAPQDYDTLGNQLELQEIESAGGVATPQVYGQLLAVYLWKNDLANAKFLWKRIPQSIKSSSNELSLIWTVGHKMWQRDFPAIYEALNKEWSDNVKNIMNAVLETSRKRAFMLVSHAYSSISADDFASFVGLPVNEAVEGAVAEGWQADPQTRMITPRKSERTQEKLIPSEEQLSRLTDFVSFLEN